MMLRLLGFDVFDCFLLVDTHNYRLLYSLVSNLRLNRQPCCPRSRFSDICYSSVPKKEVFSGE